MSTLPLQHQRQTLGRLRAAVDYIPTDHDDIRLPRVDILDNPFQGREVGMDISQNGEFHGSSKDFSGIGTGSE